ncbi:MAG: FtsX-like permease family protein [Paucibacter sp.]|nr:FtsX-like permease family protein [Roseateles sp.]
MSPRWIKLWRDLVAARGRFLSLVLALAASIAAVTTMLSSYTVLMREVPANYQGSRPASAQLELAGELDQAFVERLRAQPGVAGAELARSVGARARVGTEEWLPMQIFVVPDLAAQRINRLHPEAGAWPPPDGSVLIERSALPLTGSRIGGTLAFELPGLGARQIRISGTVQDPGVAPAGQEQLIYAYMSQATLAGLGEHGALDVLKLVLNEERDSEQIEAAVLALRPWLADQGHALRGARIPPPRMHPHQGQMNAVMAMLLVFSLMAMLLGAVLSATVIHGLLAQQIRQIAIMKAIGAGAGALARLYLSLVALLAGAALALGLPLGLWAGRVFIGATAALLNLRLQSLLPPFWVYGCVVALGLAAPLLATWLPVRAATRRSVREAMDEQGLSAGSGAVDGGLARALTRLSLHDAALTLALRNSFRRGKRLLLSVSLLAGAGAMLITCLNLRAAWEDVVQQARAARHYDLELRLQGRVDEQRLLQLVRGVEGVARVESWPSLPAALARADGLEISQRYPDGGHGGFSLRAAPLDTVLIDRQPLAGEWLSADDADGVVLNSLAARTVFEGAKPGDWIALQVEHRTVKLRVRGVLHQALTSASVYLPPQRFAAMLLQTGESASGSNALRLRLQTQEPAQAIASRLLATLAAENIGVRQVYSARRDTAAQAGHVYILIYALGFVAALMATVGLLGLASALGNAVTERTREFGVMRAIGARRGAIMRSVIGEGLVMAVLSLPLALGLAQALSAQVSRVLTAISSQQLNLTISLTGLLVWTGLLLLATLVVSAWPARRAAGLSVRQTLDFQ